MNLKQVGIEVLYRAAKVATAKGNTLFVHADGSMEERLVPDSASLVRYTHDIESDRVYARERLAKRESGSVWLFVEQASETVSVPLGV